MRIKNIVLGLSAVAAVAALAACSSGGQQASNSAALSSTSSTAAAASPTTTTTTAPTTTVPPTTTLAPTTTTTHPAPVVTPPRATQAAAPTGVPCSAAAVACVDLSTRKAWLVRNGAVVFGPVSIMPGSAAFPTPTGTFHVLFKNAHYRSREFDNAPMPDAVFFYPGDAFHVGSLGVRSHGCIHLSWTSAGAFFRTLSIGDEVQVLR